MAKGGRGTVRFTKTDKGYLVRVYASIHGKRVCLAVEEGVELGTEEGTERIIEAHDRVKAQFKRPRK